MRLNEIRTELQPGLSNIAEIDMRELKHALENTEQYPNLREELLRRMLEIAVVGDGYNHSELPEIEWQEPLRCTTHAILNGVKTLCPNMRDIVGLLKKLIFHISETSEAIANANETFGGESVDRDVLYGGLMQIATQLRGFGLPISAGITVAANPIIFARHFYRRDTFVCHETAGLGLLRHATTLIPVKNPTTSLAAYRLDPLYRGECIYPITGISMQELLDMLLSLEGTRTSQSAYRFVFDSAPYEAFLRRSKGLQ